MILSVFTFLVAMNFLTSISFLFSRFRCLVGVLLITILQKSDAATQGSCTFRTLKWKVSAHERLELKTCITEVDEVEDANFTIQQFSNSTDTTTSAFIMDEKLGVKFLPSNLFRVFPELKVIVVLYSSVTSVEENNFNGLSKLKKLLLESNKIEHVAVKAFVDLVSLEYLKLNYNKIQFFEENTFVSLKALKELYFSGNNIASLHPKLFAPLVKVEFIGFSKNKISGLDENIFDTLTNLKKIDMASNKLEIIPKDLFKNNFKLDQIKMQENKIKLIDASMFNHLTDLEFVDFDGNVCVSLFYVKDLNMDRMESYLRQNCM